MSSYNSGHHMDNTYAEYYDMGYEDAMEFSDTRIEELLNTIDALKNEIRTLKGASTL